MWHPVPTNMSRSGISASRTSATSRVEPSGTVTRWTPTWPRSSYGSSLVGSWLREPASGVALTMPDTEPVKSVRATDWSPLATCDPALRRVCISTAPGRTPDEGVTATGMVTVGTGVCSG